ncbi:MetQ/NlpA family ABC transporter substrate-binding protein [Bacillus sp. CFBP9009]
MLDYCIISRPTSNSNHWNTLNFHLATDSVDLTAVLGNFALAAKMDHKDALISEKMPYMYLNVDAVNTKDVDAQIPMDIISVVESDRFEKVIDDKFAGFGNPDWMN